MPQQFEEVVELLKYVMKTLGVKDIWYRFSKWDPKDTKKYIDNPKMWAEAQAMMKEILDKLEINYKEAEGEAAFYGPKLDFVGQGRVMTCFLDKFIKGEPVEVVEPGDQSRCFTYIDDGIAGIMKAAHAPEAEGKAFNFGINVETTMLELAELMKRIGKFKSKIVIIPAEKKYGKGYDDIFRRIPDCTRAKEILGWQPTTSLEEGLKKTIDYYIIK